MTRKNRRDPFAGVAGPGAHRSHALVLREIAGRMRNIIIEKHAPAAEAGSLAPVLEGLHAVLSRPFETRADADARRAELIAILTAAPERYARWAKRLDPGP